MGGGDIFPPVCTGSQIPENYFSNTYVLPSVNRTTGPNRYISIFWKIHTKAVGVRCFLKSSVPQSVSYYWGSENLYKAVGGVQRNRKSSCYDLLTALISVKLKVFLL